MSQKNIILFGLPNTGKTTLFNTLTNQKNQTSNFAGTTLEAKKSPIFSPENKEFTLVDLPGCMPTSSLNREESNARNLIKKYAKNPQNIFVQVINSDQWKPALLLTSELQLLGINPILLINSPDKNFHKDSPEFIDSLEKTFGNALVADITHKKFPQLFWNKISNKKSPPVSLEIGGDVEGGISQKTKFLEKNITPPQKKSPKKNYKLFDHIVVHEFWGIPIFALVMWMLFQFTFTLGAPFMDLIDSGATQLQDALRGFLSPPESSDLGGLRGTFSDLLIDGIIGGIAGIIIFVPNIFLLFLGLSVLQQSGYLARIAYLFNNLFSHIGLNGKVTVQLLMGFGCNVPSLMALRTLKTQREKVITASMIVFMSCGARLPVLTLLIAAFIPINLQGLVLWGAYFLGICVAILTGIVMHKNLPKSHKSLFCLELPDFKKPKILESLSFATEKSKNFLKKIIKIVLPMSVILWVLFTYPQAAVEEEGIEASYGAQIGKTIEPIFTPLGFDWRITTGILSGLPAKEVLVTTFAEIYETDSEDETGLIEKLQNDPVFTLPVAMALLVFVLLYTPCIAVIGVIKEEIGTKWALFGIIYPTIVAYIFAFITYQILNILI